MANDDHDIFHWIKLILCADNVEAVVKYTLADDNRQIFASKYQLHLPTEEELREELIKEKYILEAHLDTVKKEQI